MVNYYNEHDPYAAAWLRELIHDGLIAPGVVDERDIQKINGSELEGFNQIHLFAGIGGWPLALRLAGWPDDRPIWTGSCPCQSFSCAGTGKGKKDKRHLWPEMYRLARVHRPAKIIGEQVEDAIGHEWLDGVFIDLEREDYACGAVVLPAACRKAPHRRHRIFWMAEASIAERGRGIESGGARNGEPQRNMPVGAMGFANIDGRPSGRTSAARDGHRNPVKPAGFWSDFILLPCRDGKVRRASSQSSDGPLAHGVPSKNSDPRMGYVISELERLGHSAKDSRKILVRARANRVGRLKAYGNAIVPQVAAEFIRAFLDRKQ